jgi:hypothetical protein
MKSWILLLALQSIVGAVTLLSLPGFSAENIVGGLTHAANCFGKFRSIMTNADQNIKKAVHLYSQSVHGPPAVIVKVTPKAQFRKGRVELTMELFKKLLPPRRRGSVSTAEFESIISGMENILNSRHISTVKGTTSLVSFTLIRPNDIQQKTLCMWRTLSPSWKASIMFSWRFTKGLQH